MQAFSCVEFVFIIYYTTNENYVKRKIQQKRTLFLRGRVKIEYELNSLEISERIKKRLKELNYKQIDLSNNTGISKNAISNYVSGNRIPDTKSILLISQFLNVTIEWLLIGKESIYLSEEDKNLLKKYNTLNDKNKGKTENFIDERIAEQESKYTNDKTNLA